MPNELSEQECNDLLDAYKLVKEEIKALKRERCPVRTQFINNETAIARNDNAWVTKLNEHFAVTDVLDSARDRLQRCRAATPSRDCSAIEAEVTELERQADELARDVLSLKREYQSLTQERDRLKQTLENIDSNLTTLRGRRAELRNQISNGHCWKKK